MRIPQWFVPQKRILKAAQERMAERLQYVNIDSSIQECDKQLLSGFRESLARFAQRHNIAVNFNKIEGSNKTQMNIFKTTMTPHAITRKEQGNWYFATPEYKASSELPKNTKTVNFYDDLKNMIKQLADTNEIAEESQRYPLRIRHENKYYGYPR